jgi:hypothetical protein
MSKSIGLQACVDFHNVSLRTGLGISELRLIQTQCCRYHAHGGLINQFHSHLPPLALAIKSGSSVLLASAIRRSSYGDESAMNVSESKMKYYQTPFETLFDLETLQAHLKGGLLGSISTSTASTCSTSKCCGSRRPSYTIPCGPNN